MADSNAKSPSAKHIHIVLIPGFAGFDALGQLEYYGGLTPLFQRWLARTQVLHYFDNFPTAAVVTRAQRLQSYLAKRMARGEISIDDEIVLIGHSTGGLDIRRLLCDLWNAQSHHEVIVVDGGAEVKAVDFFRCIRRVVFLSVPHWGTNIADWVQEQSISRKVLVEDLRAAVSGSQALPLERIESMLAGSIASLTGAGLLCAVQDALDEANEYNGKASPARTAEAHEAASQLALYLRHMASDFAAIDDLTSRRPQDRKSPSPAHFDSSLREKEVRVVMRNIEVRSYVTLGRRPFDFEPGESAPPWELAKPWTYPEFSKDAALSAGTDIVYRTCYRACAGGPFEAPAESKQLARKLRNAPHGPIELWDNDGIVNTLSMLWPKGQNVLVAADHMDIVGQYKAIKAGPGGGRTYRTYDLLKSNAGFNVRVFEELWKDIFAFCVGRSHAKRARAAGAGGS